MFRSHPFASAITLSLLFSPTLAAQDSLTVDRIFNSSEFVPEQLGRIRWLDREAAYVKLEADSATHSIDAGGYRTSFQVRKEILP